MTKLIPSILGQAQVQLIRCAQYAADWLGEGRTINRSSDGKFAAVNSTLDKKSDRLITEFALKFTDAEQKKKAETLDSLESLALKDKIRTQLNRRGLAQDFDKTCEALRSALRSGTFRQTLSELLQFEISKLMLVSAITWCLQDDSDAVGAWLDAIAQSLNNQTDKAFVRSLKN